MKTRSVIFLMSACAVCFVSRVRAAEPCHATLIAHRGGENAPENTLAAFKDCAEKGFGFECDVRLTKDNRLFTYHDRNFAKYTHGANTTNLCALTWMETKSVNVAGKKWRGTKFDPSYPGEFENVLSLADDGRWFYVEIKPESGTRIIPYLKEAFARQKKATPKNTLFISFGEKICSEIKKQMPEYKVFFLPKLYIGKYYERYKNPQVLIDKLKELGVDGVNAPFYNKKLIALQTSEYIKAVKDAGFEYHVWTCNTIEQVEMAFERGIQTVSTDRPQKMLDAYQARRKQIK